MHANPPYTYRFNMCSPHYEKSMTCDTSRLSEFLLHQWHELTRDELEKTRFSKYNIAKLIEHKYGIHHTVAEYYLSNIERHIALLS